MSIVFKSAAWVTTSPKFSAALEAIEFCIDTNSPGPQVGPGGSNYQMLNQTYGKCPDCRRWDWLPHTCPPHWRAYIETEDSQTPPALEDGDWRPVFAADAKDAIEQAAEEWFDFESPHEFWVWVEKDGKIYHAGFEVEFTPNFNADKLKEFSPPAPPPQAPAEADQGAL